MNYTQLLQKLNLPESELLNVYQYGSRVYGNLTGQSDYDFIVIVKEKTCEQFSDNQINVNFFTAAEHQHRLNEHEISALECQFLAENFIWKEKIRFSFELDLGKLRHSLSQKSSNSWVKAKKKLTIPKDFDTNIGKKSLFHSFRIIYFGIQIATENRISDYACCNALFYEILYQYNDWQLLFETYKQQYNALLSEFRKVAPKTV